MIDIAENISLGNVVFKTLNYFDILDTGKKYFWVSYCGKKIKINRFKIKF